MNKLLAFSSTKLLAENPDWPGMERYLTFHNFFPSNVCICDRTNSADVPFDIENRWPIPKFDVGFNLSYEDCVRHRALELITLAKKQNRKIRLYYSGGIDSSVILCSFIETIGLQETTDLVELACTSHSRNENPYIWDKIVRKSKFNLIDASDIKSIVDPKYLTIMGECNDQLFGSDAMIRFEATVGEYKIYDKWSIGTITDYLSDINPIGAEYWALQLEKTMNAAPYKIENHYQFWWWYNFAWKWNNVVTRILFYLPKTYDSLVQNHNIPIQFFNCESLQQWSMMNHYMEPDRNALPYEYKFQAKQFVCKTLNENGFMNKVKNPSLFRIFYSQTQHIAVDSDYKIIRNWRDMEKYLKG